MTVTPSTEKARLRRALKELAEQVEQILYGWVSVVAADLAHARRVKEQLLECYASVAEVNGVGLVRSDGGWAVKVNLERAAPNLSVPDNIDGVAVFTDVVGPISAQ